MLHTSRRRALIWLNSLFSLAEVVICTKWWSLPSGYSFENLLLFARGGSFKRNHSTNSLLAQYSVSRRDDGCFSFFYLKNYEFEKSKFNFIQWNLHIWVWNRFTLLTICWFSIELNMQIGLLHAQLTLNIVLECTHPNKPSIALNGFFWMALESSNRLAQGNFSKFLGLNVSHFLKNFQFIL